MRRDRQFQTQADTEYPAEQCQDKSLDEELHQHLALEGPDRQPDPDFAGTFGD